MKYQATTQISIKSRNLKLLCIFSNHNAVKLEINYKRETGWKNHMKTKQHDTKEPKDQKVNQTGNPKIP